MTSQPKLQIEISPTVMEALKLLALIEENSIAGAIERLIKKEFCQYIPYFDIETATWWLSRKDEILSGEIMDEDGSGIPY